jgi:hypothetical protein
MNVCSASDPAENTGPAQLLSYVPAFSSPRAVTQLGPQAIIFTRKGLSFRLAFVTSVMSWLMGSVQRQGSRCKGNNATPPSVSNASAGVMLIIVWIHKEMYTAPIKQYPLSLCHAGLGAPAVALACNAAEGQCMGYCLIPALAEAPLTGGTSFILPLAGFATLAVGTVFAMFQ